MTAQKAIKFIKEFKKINKFVNDMYAVPSDEIAETYDIAISALEKQIPHKLAPKQSRNSEIPVCGKCNGIMDLMQGELNYCPNCGQALDWSD